MKVAVASALIMATHVIAAYFASGRTDPFYLRFTGPKQHALIIGTSRAAQGLKPDVLAAEMPQALSTAFMNFAFTVDHSPFGKVYLEAIEKKLAGPSGRSGVFMVAVDPWGLSTERGSAHLRELDFPLAEQMTFTGTPNYEYLIRNFHSGWGGLIAGPNHEKDSTMILHANGWLEIRVPMDHASVQERTKRKVEDYVQKGLLSEPSAWRVMFLGRTLDLLMERGKVVLVRIPICEELALQEDAYWPGFHQLMTDMANVRNIQFIDLMPELDRYTYTDGNHLDSLSARRLSKDLAKRLGELLSN